MEPRIVIFGGTTEGRLLAQSLQYSRVQVHICVATQYGATLLKEAENIHIHEGRMSEPEMEKFMEEHSVSCCVDATHPYAVEVSRNVGMACERQNVSYIRVLRDEAETQAEEANYFDSISDAVKFLDRTEGKILITTGSKELEDYTGIRDYEKRCIARVLPTLKVMEKCKNLGFDGSNVIAMQGPFGRELNLAMLRQSGAKWLVSKMSGKEGGFEDKCAAAKEAGVGLVLIGRPKESESAVSLRKALDILVQKYDLKLHRKAALIGMGPGAGELLTKQACKALEECDVMIGAQRILDMCRGQVKKPVFVSYRKEEILRFLEEHLEYRRVALLYSGDIGFYSGARGMGESLRKNGFEVEHVSGISSMMYFLNTLGVSHEDVLFESCHGKEENLIGKICSHKKVCTLIGDEAFLQGICGKLQEYDLENVKITVGECLSYPDMQIFSGNASELAGRKVNRLSVVLFENDNAGKNNPHIHDGEFVRGRVPMTREEIRILSIAKMELREDSIVYDIGAGTGSVSVEMARQCPLGKVYAVERKKEAVKLLRENRKKFRTDNLQVIEGSAPCALEGLPVPDAVFIGGSDGKLTEIIDAVRGKNKNARFVMNAITVETLTKVTDYFRVHPEYGDGEMICVNVARAKRLAGYHLMEAENPIYIISFGGEDNVPKEQ